MLFFPMISDKTLSDSDSSTGWLDSDGLFKSSCDPVLDETKIVSGVKTESENISADAEDERITTNKI